VRKKWEFVNKKPTIVGERMRKRGEERKEGMRRRKKRGEKKEYRKQKKDVLGG
jgi:ribose 1,5-bisphosphokinase PhnN|tara:strand:- start:737 stop:895 length:159 start_codon:yes stop_codon:yes gene_type:complete